MKLREALSQPVLVQATVDARRENTAVRVRVADLRPHFGAVVDDAGNKLAKDGPAQPLLGVSKTEKRAGQAQVGIYRDSVRLDDRQPPSGEYADLSV
jgi:hypothetical protein